VKIAGILLALIGIALLVVSLLADVIGIGSPGFGKQQIEGAIVGAVVAAVGLFLIFRKK
jgi:hypothetical protein